MSIQICRVVELVMRSAFCQTIRNTSCSRKAVLGPVGPSCLYVPGVSVIHRRAYSLDTLSSHLQPTLASSSQQPRIDTTSPSTALTQRNLSDVAIKVQYRPLCQYEDFDDMEETVRLAKTCKTSKQFILDPHLAKLITQLIGPVDAKTVVFECNPGPGVLTRTLLNAGVQRVVALEGSKSFLHTLQQLEGRLDGQLEVVHCDFFKLDPIGIGNPTSPVLFSDKLFTDLGISEANWTDDIPVKVVAIVPRPNERGFMLKMLYSLFERQSIYRYGRIELNLFIRESEYKKMVSSPGNMITYRHLSVLWQIACDIELLHEEPWQSYATSVAVSSKKLRQDRMCLVRLRPRADLFSGGLTPSNASTLIMMVKQCLIKRRAKLIDKLNVWSPDSGSKLLAEMNLSEDIVTGHVFPEEYLRLFSLIDKSQEFKESWLYQEVLENSQREGWN